MTGAGQTPKVGLNTIPLTNLRNVYWSLPPETLYEHAVRNAEGQIAHAGPLVVDTSPYTGRSPDDKFVVEEDTSAGNIWWGKVNVPFAPERFDRMLDRMRKYLAGKDVYVQDCRAGADAEHRLPIRIVTEWAWHSLFARTMFRGIDSAEELRNHAPEFTVIGAPGLKADPRTDGTNNEAFILLNFARKMVLIGGTGYAGEIKKSIFAVLNYLLPLKNVASMHCSANAGEAGDAALFFGLSGTGKTTLSADPKRRLIGDDEHGWSERGVFNFEGGCYAKAIRLSAESEPEIFETTRRFGTLLENVVFDPDTRRLDLDDDRITENTRASYPLTHIPNVVPDGQGGHPKNVIMLTCDASGVMPPIAALTPEQAMYHFLSGYTAKVAGTEKGLGKSPSATFSTCFGAPFLVHPPTVYSKLLSERIRQNHAKCWLVNTGWSGGPYGVGSRMKIAHSRAMIDAALTGALEDAEMREDAVLGLRVPASCPGVPAEVLDPQNTWSDKEAYRTRARELVGLFKENFKQFEGNVRPEVLAAGPR
ncbi:MAG: phosphoenolpyruvate carboxykinase (ATP) [Candidatus Krumholzibacteriia bacterium]